jgi:SulP family sulfate permease
MAAFEMTSRDLRFNIRELSGALGDIGVLVPLSVGLIALNGFHPAAVFLPAGLLYVGAGLWYRVPIPVQPLKSMAAVALAMGFGPRVMSAGGILVGVVLVGLAAAGLTNSVARLMSKPLVRGIQVSVGVLLIWSGARLMVSQPVVGGLHAGAVVGLATAFALICLGSSRRVPAALLVLLAGAAAGAILGGQAAIRPAGSLSLSLPRGPEWLQALVFLVLPQIPLTLANAVCATWQTARDCFGEGARRVTHRGLAFGMGLTGLFAGLIGGMPVCHGSGGLTAHYRLGARTGGAPVMMGLICLALAAAAAAGWPLPLGIVPHAVYGGMLLYVGAHHALLARDLVRFPADMGVAVGIGLVTAATGNIGVGFAAGIGLLAATRAIAAMWRMRANARA